MCALRMVVWAVIAAVAWPLGEATAVSRRKECRLSCGPAIERCVTEGGRRRRCKRETLRSCRREGLEVCGEPTTTSTSTTSPGATTSVPGGSTTTMSGASTTTIAGASTTTMVDASTTTMPTASTTSTTLPEVHGCTSANAVDRSGPSDDRTVTFVSYQYTPKCIRIVAGQTVTFSGDFEVHPLVGGEVVGSTANPDPSSPIPVTASGTMQSVVFDNDGIFPYFCAAHGQTNAMFGAVFVDP